MSDITMEVQGDAPRHYDESKIVNRLVTAEPKNAPRRSPEEHEAWVQATWAELGVQGVRPTRSMVFLRTEKPRLMTDGGIIMPNATGGFYGGLPKGRFVWATVLVCGPDCHEVQAGDIVLFGRGHFARWGDTAAGRQALEDGALVGWIDESNIEGVLEEPPQEGVLRS
jgi:hypothetical protein